jgi:hypothetical protein
MFYLSASTGTGSELKPEKTFCRRLKVAFFVATRRLIKIKWHCCRSSYPFRIIMPKKGIIVPRISYSFTAQVFHTISLPTL